MKKAIHKIKNKITADKIHNELLRETDGWEFYEGIYEKGEKPLTATGINKESLSIVLEIVAMNGNLISPICSKKHRKFLEKLANNNDFYNKVWAGFTAKELEFIENKRCQELVDAGVLNIPQE